MSTTCPIRKEEDLQRFKNYYLEKGNMRNYLLIVVGLNTALRIGDVLKLKWEDVYDEHWGRFRRHLNVVEQKTGKQNYIALNDCIISTLEQCYHGQKGRGIPVLYQPARQPADQPESGVADHPQSRRGNRAGRAHQLSFPAQNIWLSCMETGRFPGYANDDLQPFVLSDHETLSRNHTGRKRRRVLSYKIIDLIRSILKSISCAKGFSLPQYFVRISKNKKYTKISKKGLSPW